MSARAEFPPHVLRDYALIADGERGALIGPRGDIAWLCAPRWDSDAVFSNLIGGAGAYAIWPDDERFVWGGYYEPGTLIWRSRWVTTDGVVESRDALAFPGDPAAATVLRRICAVDGPARVRVLLDPRHGFGSDRVRDLAVDRGVWTGRTGSLYFRWSNATRARRTAQGLMLVVSLDPGEERDLVLELSEEPFAAPPPEPGDLWESTAHAWKCEIPDVSDTLAPADARHAFAVIRGLTSRAGGMVAAATASLPERSEGGRSYDYRYVWIRDQCYAGHALAAVGSHELFDQGVQFVTDRLLSDGADLTPAYTVGGGKVPGEQNLRDLSGYPGGTNIIGNRVTSQFQLDAFGECLLLFATAGRHDRLDPTHWRAVETAVAAISKRWTEPDAGIWELEPERWTHSRLICVAGLRAIAAEAPAHVGGEWTALADAILGKTAQQCLHPSGRWQRSTDDDKVDAALLLPGIRGAVPADDPRTVATLDAVRDELADDHFVYRFRHDRGPLARAEGAFVLCGFLMALAEHQQGNAIEAVRYFERNRTACGPPGMFSEEFDVDQRQLRGNLPQAFVHALMLEAAARLPGARD